MNLTPIKTTSKKSKDISGERKILYWRAPMNPNEVYDSPGKSKMGMDLVPVYEDEGNASGVVTVDGSVLQSMNVKVEFVKNRKMDSSIYTNGIVTTDERNEFAVTTKISGWVEKLYVNYTGQEVKKGQKLVDIYSPELVAAQQELISTLQMKDKIQNLSNEVIIKNSVSKLELFDISKTTIDKIISTKKVEKYLPLFAPFDGTVLTKSIIEGEKIKEGMELMKIANLDNLWLKADIYESDLNLINMGSSAEVKFNYNPGKIYKGKISFIYPTINSKTRTASVRIDLNNKDNDLKPAMFANVEIKSKVKDEAIAVPETALIRSGKKNIIVLALGEGQFKPVEVTIGNYSDGYYEVLSGIKLNDKIVTSGQFMIDSESNLRSAINLLSTNAEAKTAEMSDAEMKNMDSAENSNLEEHNHDNSIVHDGNIDLEAIDKNNDGKVFQDPMDWNVISDKAGRCPICNMILEEVSINEAKKNLKENGFEYK